MEHLQNISKTFISSYNEILISETEKCLQ